MYLKSLVLKGFKSFADRSVLSLEPGITAVVGPNGSGKSNISDAVLWVLGERNAKNLRGQAMEDVIFAGSSARKPVSVAEVDLVLDNSDGTLPVEFNEVALTRRMYRSGESEYLINGAPARRMDFLDILHDTGLGTGTHSIISQGNLDAILSSKPVDRRALIEEAAGVLKHKQRKERSARKIAQMENHLNRVKDVTAEVERQLKPLARKAQRAQAYQGLADQLKELELVLAVDSLRQLQTRWDEVLLQEKETAALIDVKRLELSEAEARLEKLQSTLQEKGLYVGDLTAQRGRFHMVVERLDAADMVLSEKARTIYARLQEAENTISSSTRRIEYLEEDVAGLEEEYNSEVAKRDQLERDLRVLELQCAEVSQERIELDGELSQAQGELRAREKELEELVARLSQKKDSVSGLVTRKRILSSRKDELDAEIVQLTADFEERCQGVDQQAAALETLAQEAHDAAARVGEAESALRLAEVTLASAREDTQKVSAQISALEQINASLRAQNDAARWVSEHVTEVAVDATTLSSLIKAPKDLETLVEHLLGSDLMAACVSDADSALKLMDALLDKHLKGDTSVLYAQGSWETCPKIHDASAVRLLDELTYPEHMNAVLDMLLGDVYVVDSKKDAFTLAERTDATLRFVTREGIVVCGPRVSYSVKDNEGDGILARERELSDLREKLAVAVTQTEELETRKADLAADVDRKRALSLELSQNHAQRKGAYTSAQAERERLASRLGAARANADTAARDLQEVTDELANVEPIIEDMTVAVEQLRQVRTDLDIKRNTLSAERSIAFEDEQNLISQVNEVKLSRATSVERVRSIDRQLRERREDVARAMRACQRAQGQLSTLRIASNRIEPLHDVFSSLKETAQHWVDDLAGRAALEQSSSQELNTAINDARKAVREAQDATEAASERLNGVRVEKGRLEVQVETAVKVVVEDCAVPLDKALETPAPENREAMEAEALKLRKRITNMGTIDSSAGQEYEDMKARYDYLVSQVEDVEAARRALKRIVSAIDDRMKEQFDITFEAVNKNFQEIFSVLFPGGKASLELVDADDPNTLGVEVNAQPRGKRIAKMMLMSGGEKSLTAIALLFAVYRIRSTPFYILDEVEAALDDTNLRRLTGYLATLRDETQLIMITHQRRTMEMSDVLYGVSMQADGVTKVVSQKLDHALKQADN